MADENKEEKKGKKVRIFHTGGIYGPLDTDSGRLSPGSSLEVPESLAKKLCASYKHVKLAKDVIPEDKKPEDGSDKLDALQKKFDEQEKVGKELAEKYEELGGLYAESEKGAGVLRTALGDFLKVSDKKLKDLQKKHADLLKPAEDPKGSEGK